MEKRYQVFISSTYTDLVEERNEVMQALLELECMPSGMELFPASNETQWNWIKKVINESDYYIVIVGGKYGTISEEMGLSYTEMEYRYALEKNIPVIGFLYEDINKLPSERTEIDVDRRSKLEDFRELVKKKLCKFFNSPSDLGAKVSRSMTQLKKQFPAIGWIRADVVNDNNYSKEILRLRDENEVLQKEIEILSSQAPADTLYLESGKDEFNVEFVFTRNKINEETGRYRKYKQSASSIIISWDDLLKQLAPNLLLDDNSYYSRNKGNVFIGIIMRKSIQNLEEKYPEENFTDFLIRHESLNTILMQFRALKYITINKEGRWELTKYGDKYYTELIAIRKK
ncbi:MAG: DUF4062 domain-containing protein [Spirochaetaceae bacterium]|jgi:hypothetical protein|nr:DUF4062 domain-containing protein [Spirochaetaceae bacterium]